MDMAMDHSGHNHSAMASPSPMMHDHGAVLRHADGTYYYTHGAWLGHVVPGTFFVIWGTWWAIAVFWEHLRATSQNKPFKSQAWYRVFFGPAKLQRVPLEPIIKIVLPFFGILGELWLGHDQYMNLYDTDGKFFVDHINDWQHSSMYSAFILSGLVDLGVEQLGLPAGLDTAMVGMAFLIEGLLLAFHLKGPSIEIRVHLILVIQIFFTVVAVLAEGLKPSSFVAACCRPLTTIVQGVWWIQTAYIMFRAKPEWDPEYMGSAMMAPVVWVSHAIWIAAAMLATYVCLRIFTERVLGWAYRSGARGPVLRASPTRDPAGKYGAAGTHDVDLEMSALVGDRF